MVNRALQAKRVKAKRMKRAYLQSPKHAAPNIGWTSEYHARAHVTTAFDRWFFNIDHIPDDATAVTDAARRAELGVESPLSIIKSYKEELIERMRLFVEEPVPHSVVLDNAMPSYAILMFWSAGQHAWWFVKKDMDSKLLYKSRKYSSRDKAVRDFSYENIHWSDSIPLTF